LWEGCGGATAFGGATTFGGCVATGVLAGCGVLGVTGTGVAGLGVSSLDVVTAAALEGVLVSRPNGITIDGTNDAGAVGAGNII